MSIFRLQKSILRTISARLAIVLFITFWLGYWTHSFYHNSIELENREPFRTKNAKNYCQLPKVDPWDPSIAHLIGKPNLQWSQPVIALRNTTINNKGSHSSYSYQCFKSKNEAENDLEERLAFDHRSKPACEFYVVECRQLPSNTTLYRMPFAEGLKKVEGIQRTFNPFQPSVVIIVLDSVSQSSAKRRLSKTLDYLQKEFGLIIFQSHSKVGLNSDPNGMAAFMGKNYHKPVKQKEGNNQPIWHEFKKKQYTTLFVEDEPTHSLRERYFGTEIWTFFRETPVDYTMQGTKPEANHRVAFKYFQSVLANHKDNPLFALLWMSHISHGQYSDYDDEFFFNFFQKNKPYLSETFLIFMSDHGPRFGQIRNTEVGRLEENMPLLSIAVPERFRGETQIVSNLRANSKLLTSHYDIYVTLQDILTAPQRSNWSNFEQQEIWNSFTDVSRGDSLLRPIQERNCNDLEILFPFCICQYETIRVSNSTLLQGLAEIVINSINSRLPLSRCARLRMTSSNDTVEILGQEDYTGRLFRTTITTAPGNAIFQATINMKNDAIIIGQIDRLNVYGNTSACVTDWDMKRMCFCK